MMKKFAVVFAALFFGVTVSAYAGTFETKCMACHNAAGKPAPSKSAMVKKFKTADDFIKASKENTNPMMNAVKNDLDSIKKSASELYKSSAVDTKSKEQAELSQPAAVASEPDSALIQEMLTLDSAFKEIVSAVALQSSDRVLKAIEPMHGTMEKTHEAVKSGNVTIRKNQKKIATFIQMDKSFHANLASLEAAAKKNNQKLMASTTKKLFDGCISCHQMFRP
ncbi:MAG: cytochrome c [Nitrospirae bacterium]|nr:cytochrome c [Nitrospirota bacterium]